MGLTSLTSLLCVTRTIDRVRYPRTQSNAALLQALPSGTKSVESLFVHGDTSAPRDWHICNQRLQPVEAATNGDDGKDQATGAFASPRELRPLPRGGTAHHSSSPNGAGSITLPIDPIHFNPQVLLA